MHGSVRSRPPDASRYSSSPELRSTPSAAGATPDQQRSHDASTRHRIHRQDPRSMTALLVTGCTCAMTLGGGLVALRLEAYRAFVLAFAAGALVASALMDVLPDAMDLLLK